MGIDITIVRNTVTRRALQQIADRMFNGEFVKAVVDIDREILAIGGELHADEEQVLIADGSRQRDLWGINLYPARADDGWIEYDSMINLRPSQGNRTRSVDDPAVRECIVGIIDTRVTT